MEPSGVKVALAAELVDALEGNVPHCKEKLKRAVTALVEHGAIKLDKRSAKVFEKYGLLAPKRRKKPFGILP